MQAGCSRGRSAGTQTPRRPGGAGAGWSRHRACGGIQSRSLVGVFAAEPASPPCPHPGRASIRGAGNAL